MFINIIDKFVSNFIDNFYSKKIKNTKINKDDAIVNLVTIYYDNNIKQILKSFDINISKLNTRLQLIVCRYLIHYYYLNFFLSKLKNNYDEDLKQIKSFFSSKFNKDNNDYFNEESNTEIINYLSLSLDIIYKLKDKEYLLRNSESANIWKFISGDLLDKIKLNVTHNVIKIILLKYHHLQNREQIFYLLTEDDEPEFKDIEIVVDNDNADITYSLIQNLFNINDDNLINRIFKFVNENTVSTFKKKNNNINFQNLVNSKYIYLISDDFLRYHKDNFRYDSEFLTENADKKSRRRINVAVNRTNKVAKMYSQNLTTSEKEELLIIMNNRMRKSMVINDVEEVKIIKRIYDQGKTIIDNEYYEDLIKIRDIPYNNFVDFKHSGITVQLEKSVKLIRYCSIEYMKSSASISTDNTIQMRNSGKKKDCNIVGIYIPSNNPSKFNINNIIQHDKIDTQLIYKLLHESLNNKLKKTNVFIFKEQLNQEYISNLFNNIYIEITNKIFNRIFKKLELSTYTEIYDYLKVLNIYSDKFIKINYDKDLYNNFINIIYNKNFIKDKYKNDPNQKKSIKYSSKKIKDTFNKINTPTPAICQHHIEFAELQKMNKNSDLYTNAHFEFTKKYVQHEYEGDQIKNIICKSCNELLKISNFVGDGSYDENNNFITFYTSKYTELKDSEEYSKYSHIIEYMGKHIDKISELFNLSYHGLKRTPLKDNRIKESINLIKYNFYSLKFELNNKEKFLKYVSDFNIDSTNVFSIDLDLVDISVFTKNDEDKSENDKIFINNFNSYIIVSIIFNITTIDVAFIKTHNKFNIKSFEKVKNKLFEKYKIINNLHTKSSQPILDFNVLCYLIFILSSFLLDNKLWYSKNGNRTLKTHLEIIDTIVDIINRVLLVNDNVINIIYKHFYIKNTSLKNNISRLIQIYRIKFLKNLNELFNSKKVYKQIYINYTKQQIDKEISESLGEIGEKYTISNIKSTKKCHYTNIKPDNYILFTKKYYAYPNLLRSSLRQWNMDKLLIDKIYLNTKDQLCRIKKLDFCKISNLEKNNKNNIFNYWKKHQTDQHLKKQTRVITAKQKNKKYVEHISEIYRKMNSIKIKDYVYDFCKFIKNKVYYKYKKDINIDNDQYSINFFFNLKGRKNKFFIDKSDVNVIENIFPNISDKNILSFNSKKEKTNYFFNISTLGFIGYKFYNKELVVIDTNVYRYYLVEENSFFTKLKTIGFNNLNLKKTNDTLSKSELSIQITNQISIIKKYIRMILKYINIIINDKTLLTNDKHEYLFLAKYIKNYNISFIKLVKPEYIPFKNWIFIYNEEKESQYDSLQKYFEKYNYPLFYLIHELKQLIQINKDQESELCFFIFDILNDIILKENTDNNDFKQQIAQYFIEIEQTNLDRFFKNQLGDDNFNNLKDTKQFLENNEGEPDIQEEGYDMMDNDNDEDDMMESDMS